MKRIILTGLAVVLVLGLCSTAFAFNGAHQGNGGLIALGLANYQTTNLGNTWINPAAVNAYKNKAWGFLGSYDNTFSATPNKGNGNNGRDAMAGAHFDTPAGVIGIWINRGSSAIDPATSSIGAMDDRVNGVPMRGAAFYGEFATVDGTPLVGQVEILGDGIGDEDGICEGVEACEDDTPLKGLSTPHNNLDLFYGRDIGAALIGVRLNLNMSKDVDEIDVPTNAQPFGQLAGQTNTQYTADGEETVNARDLGLHFGVAMKEMPINASLLIGLPSASDELSFEQTTTQDSAGVSGVADQTDTETVDDTLESDGAMNIGLYVNGAVELSDMTTLVPTVFFEKTKNNSTLKSSYTSTTTYADSLAGTLPDTTVFESEATREGSGMVFGVDGALNMKPNDATLVVTALGLTYLKSEVSVENEIVVSTTTSAGVTTYNDTYGPTDENATQESSTIAIPFVVGVQNKTWKTVTTRLGMKGNIYQRTKTTTTETEHYNTIATPSQAAEDRDEEEVETSSGTINDGNPVTVSMGFSVKLGESMGLTAVLNEDILFGGGYLISGLPETLSTIVSVGYSW